jgi:cation:H+ antiporter
MGGSIVVIATVFVLASASSLSASVVLARTLERLGERLELTEAMLGLVAALATDAPEITSAATALVQRQHAVGVGVVAGSNLYNLAALLGLGAVVAGRIALHRKVVLLEGALALWVAAVTFAALIGWLGPRAGLALVLVVLAGYVVLSAMHPARREQLPLPGSWRAWLASAVDQQELELLAAVRPRKGGPRDAAVAVVMLVLVVGASVVMERAASAAGALYSVPGIVIGGIVLAAVTSIPDTVTAIHLATRGRGSAALSVALNSNTLNVVVGLFLPAVATGLAGSSGIELFVAACYAGLTLGLLALAFAQRGLDRRAGGLIIALYLVFATIIVLS